MADTNDVVAQLRGINANLRALVKTNEEISDKMSYLLTVIRERMGQGDD